MTQIPSQSPMVKVAKKLITCILIHRKNEEYGIAMKSLKAQTIADEIIIIKVEDEDSLGASWARNEGVKRMRDLTGETEFLLFSDNDINWQTNALETMVKVLKLAPKASYAYGRWRKGNQVYSHFPFQGKVLKETNFISTMSLFRTKDFPKEGFDESIKRLNDWELFLRMFLRYNKRGVYVNDLIFETSFPAPGQPSITEGHPIEEYHQAVDLVRKKYNLPRPAWDRRFSDIRKLYKE